jgi:hypothetical protein
MAGTNKSEHANVQELLALLLQLRESLSWHNEFSEINQDRDLPLKHEQVCCSSVFCVHNRTAQDADTPDDLLVVSTWQSVYHTSYGHKPADRQTNRQADR